MSRSQHGQTGGGGVKRPGGLPPSQPPRGAFHGGGYHERPDDKVENHWPDYLQGGYFDEAGSLRIQYVSRLLPGHEQLPDARQQGLDRLIYTMANASPKLTTAQVRRFFGHCRTLETRLKSGAATWAQLRAQFEFLDAAATDALGKTPRKIPSLFHDFIRRNVAAVHSEKDFLHGFLPHFEALVGFGSIYLKDRN